MILTKGGLFFKKELSFSAVDFEVGEAIAIWFVNILYGVLPTAAQAYQGNVAEVVHSCASNGRPRLKTNVLFIGPSSSGLL